MQNLASLAAAPENATVVSAIRQASAKSGVDFTYLLQKAATESSLNPTAQATTSSASGLYQFIDQTWLTEMSQHGAEYGLGRDASAITIDSSGHASVSDPAMRREIMAMKDDPTVAAEMAASFTKDNQSALAAAGIGSIGPTELYLAHFLGAGGAAKFLSAMRRNPAQPAAGVVPAAADANEPVFYHADGSARSLGEVYNRFAARFGGASANVSQTAAASASAAYASAGNFSSFAPSTGASSAMDAADEWGQGRASIYEMMMLSQLGITRPASEEDARKSSTSL